MDKFLEMLLFLWPAILVALVVGLALGGEPGTSNDNDVIDDVFWDDMGD